MENSFNEKDSLRLINEMINLARNNYKKGAGMYCIFWGYMIAALSLSNFILLHVFQANNVNYNYSFSVWWLTIPVAIIFFIYVKKNAKKELVTTHINKVVYNLWIAFGISCSIFLLVLNFFASYYKMVEASLLITPIILIMVGLAQFASAAVLRFRLYYYAALVFWVGALVSIAALLVFERGDIQFLILAACMILGFCVPGHILNSKAEQDV